MTHDQITAQDAALAEAVGRIQMRAGREAVEARTREVERLVARRAALVEQLINDVRLGSSEPGA